MLERITIDPNQMGGQPTIRGLRIPVATVMAMDADGMTTDEIITELPELETDGIAEALRYTAEAVRERQLPQRGFGWTSRRRGHLDCIWTASGGLPRAAGPGSIATSRRGPADCYRRPRCAQEVLDCRHHVL